MTTTLAILINALVLVVFVNRYVSGWFVRLLRGRSFDETTDDFEPTVTVIVPMFNEGAGIARTIDSLMAQRYPRAKLDVLVIDDCSADDSHDHALLAAAPYGRRVRVVRNPVNTGKRRSIIRAVRTTDAEIIVSVDSDVVVDAGAIRELVRRFVTPEIAAVGGRVDIINKHDNWLTRMQTIKYHFAYSFMKNLERSFRRVLCLSGCLTAYRRAVLVELEPVLDNRSFCGVPIKYGEDRFLTRQIIKAGYHTTLTLDAVCRTVAPATLGSYFSQQIRWRRSNIVDYVGGASHVWRLNPIIAINFFALTGLLVAYPVLLLQAVSTGVFFPLMTLHIAVVALFGLVYRLTTRHLPASERVAALSFIPMTFVMPVAYALLTPLALFTLDSGSWETRGHVVPEALAASSHDDSPLAVTGEFHALRTLALPGEGRVLELHSGAVEERAG